MNRKQESILNHLLNMETNRIYLGDAYELIKGIPDKSIDLIYTDIPYAFTGNGLNVGGGAFGTKKRNYHDEYASVAENSEVSGLTVRRTRSNAEMQEIAYGIDYKILDEFVRVLKHIYIYIWCSKEQVLPIMDYFINKHHCFHDILVWGKKNPIPTANGTYLPDLEYCLMFREKGTKIGGTYHTKSKYYISAINKDDKDDYNHPCIKPITFVENHIFNSTNENDIVLDPFVGSGTTCLAAKHLNRQYIGFEINETYYKIACDRLAGINQRGEINLFDYED